MNKIKYFLALQAFQFDIFIYYSLATQFSLNWWCQSSISMNSGETKVDAIVFNSVKSGRKLEHWPPPLTMYNSGLVHLWLKNHAVILICFFPWERCWNPPMNCHCWGGCIVWANLCNKQTSATRKGFPSDFKHLTMTNWEGCILWSTVSIFTSRATL